MNVYEMLEDIRQPDKKKKVILDTDTFNEIDDQYALAYCLLADNIELIAACAAPFYNDNSESYEDGMLKSYDEIKKVLSLTCPERNVPVYHGSRTTIEAAGKAVDSPAARFIVDTVKNSSDPIWVLGIGACTNIASALLLDPSIKDNMCVIWLGANWLQGDNLGEFNLVQDYTAGQYLINSGVPLLLCPAWFVVSELTADVSLKDALKGHNPLCDYLYQITQTVFEKAGSNPAWVRTIWDIAAPAILDIPDCAEIDVVSAPVLTDSRVYAFDSTRHKMLYLKKIHREPVFKRAWSLITSI